MAKKYLDYDGLKYLWSKIDSKIESATYGFLNINLTTNQPGGGEVETSFNVNVDGISTEYQYNNAPVAIKIKGGSNYIVTFNEIDGYSTPESVSGKVEAGITYDIEKQYKACLLTFSITPSNASAIVSYKNTTVTNGSTLLVPFTPITVTPNELDGYESPSSQTFTPTTATQTVTLTYEEILTEVFIVDTNGNLVTTNDWSGGSNCTGIALINDNVSLIIAPDEWCTYKYNTSEADPAWNGNSRSAWGGYNTTVSGIKTTTSRSDAITDFAGSANTDAIISQLKGKTDNYSQYYTGAPAAEYCRAYSKGYKGAGQWYLPSAGEYNQIVQNASDINAAIAKVSGESLDAYYFVWTSTQYSANFAWYYYWNDEYFSTNYKSDYIGVRPVCQY